MRVLVHYRHLSSYHVGGSYHNNECTRIREVSTSNNSLHRVSRPEVVVCDMDSSLNKITASTEARMKKKMAQYA